MIRRNTWFVLVVLIALIGFAYYLTRHKAQQAANATPTPAAGNAAVALFAADLGAPSGIKIVDAAGQSVELVRNGSGVWVLNAPASAPADQAAAEAGATQVTSLRVLSTVQLGLDIVGLDKPSYTASITFAGGKVHVLKIGALTPIQDGYYTSLDDGPIQIVDKAGLDAVVQMLTKPPFAATPEPPTPTAPATEAGGAGLPVTTGTPAAPAAASPTP